MTPDQELELKARGLESAILQSLMNASVDPEREDHWRAHADKLERKFTTQHGRHYSHFIRRGAMT